MTIKPATVMSSLLVLAACATGYEQDADFNAWVVSAEIQCNRRYGAVPTWAPEESSWFRETAYQAYRGDLSRNAFANRLRERYPGYEATTECIADAVPRTR